MRLHLESLLFSIFLHSWYSVLKSSFLWVLVQIRWTFQIAQAMRMPFRKLIGLNNWSAVNPRLSLACEIHIGRREREREIGEIFRDVQLNGCFCRSSNEICRKSSAKKSQVGFDSNVTEIFREKWWRKCDWLTDWLTDWNNKSCWCQWPVGGKGAPLSWGASHPRTSVHILSVFGGAKCRDPLSEKSLYVRTCSSRFLV